MSWMFGQMAGVVAWLLKTGETYFQRVQSLRLSRQTSTNVYVPTSVSNRFRAG
jgi:hypothetical protein